MPKLPPPITKPSTRIRLFASDIDGTLLGKADAALAFRLTWEGLEEKKRPLLCYNTGRLLDDTLGLIRKKLLPEPDFLICGVGTVIYDFGRKEELKSFQDILEEGWDRNAAEEVMRERFPDARLQPAHYQNPYKSSWYLEDADPRALAKLEKALGKRGLEVHVVYSSQRDLDILPKYANKGNALDWLIKRLKIKRAAVAVAGDTGNDTAMLCVEGVRPIVVGNAQPELHEATVGRGAFFAEECFADGVLEGLQALGVIQAIRHPDDAAAAKAAEGDADDALQHFLDEEDIHSIGAEDRAFLQLAYAKALDGLRRNITPMGFSACSLTDNETRGTDENYRSVWARDGAIAVIGALRRDDADLIECSRKTLVTLLEHVSPTGQIPANVSIDTQRPDYSGVGGISSIDSGLWVIIAVHDYVKKTRDLDLLRHFRPVLQSVMNWLSAHDSNNDALLEIPEAGDWTDLFGRSYNILYDEVLWYRANISFGRLLEMLGEWQPAGDYLRWSGTIKQAILHKFWPSSGAEDKSRYSFADKQMSLGDTNYLIAQVTPFDFDWRCDVYGNILALLYNVLDIDRAKIAFRFMWGVGVNEPFPVANLYPVVQSGDPGWRQYYLVNLLNLPHHYHNGGIWPFVGGQWVRFINRLGLREVALTELVRLARLNQSGVQHDWEFNEWAHGKTGRPMGKAFQAWSCSEFIHACHDLRLKLPDDTGPTS
jgi:sucrose-6F-phosphate phosphohydrolase